MLENYFRFYYSHKKKKKKELSRGGHGSSGSDFGGFLYLTRTPWVWKMVPKTQSQSVSIEFQHCGAGRIIWVGRVVWVGGDSSSFSPMFLSLPFGSPSPLPFLLFLLLSLFFFFYFFYFLSSMILSPASLLSLLLLFLFLSTALSRASVDSTHESTLKIWEVHENCGSLWVCITRSNNSSLN